MKTTNKFLALALMAVAMVFASCSKDNNDSVGPTQQEIEAKIVGKWKRMLENGHEVVTNKRTVYTYNADLTATKSTSQSYEEIGLGFVWSKKQQYVYNISGNTVCNKEAFGVLILNEEIVSISNTEMCQRMVRIGGNEEKLAIYQKVTADYSQDIIGMWEGVDMTGYETYGDYHHRIEYRADGTYTYYSWDESTQAWKPLEDVFDEWNVDGDWLATRWQNNGSDVMNYEWWDIDYIKQEGDDTIMKWSALREKEDGTRFNTTFTWKKVK